MSERPTCGDVQEALSARLDGESAELLAHVVDAHMAHCENCRDFLDAATALHGAVRVRPAPVVPDRTRQILAAARATDRRPVWLVARLLLGVVAVFEGAIFAPALLFGDDGSIPPHAARHLGAFGIAFAVALFVVAIRPQQARSMVPMTATLAVAMVASAVVDTLNHKTSPFLETHHLLEVLGMAFVWLLAVPSAWPRRGGDTQSASTSRHRLRVTSTRDADHSEKRDETGSTSGAASPGR